MATKKKKVCFEFNVGDHVMVVVPTLKDDVNRKSDDGCTGVIKQVKPQDGFDYLVELDNPIEVFGLTLTERLYTENQLIKCADMQSTITMETSLGDLIIEERNAVDTHNAFVRKIEYGKSRIVEMKKSCKATSSQIATEIRLMQKNFEEIDLLKDKISSIRTLIKEALKTYL